MQCADIAINKNEEPSIGVCYTQYTQYKSLLKLERPDTNPQRLEVEIKLLSNVDLETADPPIVRNISPVLSMRGQLELRPIYDNLHALLVPLSYRSLVPFVLTKSQGAEDLFNASIENLLKPNFDKAAGLNVSDSPDKKSFMQMMTITSKDNENTSEFLLIRLGRGYFSAEPKQYLDQSLEQEPLQNEAACLFEKSDDAK